MSMATLYIDNQPYPAKEGDNLLQQCLTLGFDLPYFCWHPAMGSVGACRQCAIKEFKSEADTRGKIVMACMTPVADGARISLADPEAREFRASVSEWLMVNHPHDCPVCDEGGECHLQDMTVMTGHVYRRYRGTKRTFHNQDLGPLVNHEMNRCIQCYRCVRFYRDYAGGRDFDAYALRNHVYFGRQQDGTLESEFSGNLVEICPTGVFTDKTLKQHYARKWDLQTAPSVCVHCGLGCNTIPGERYGRLLRIRNRYNGAVNGYFLCDRGRYGYEFVNDERRIHEPLLRERRGEALRPASGQEALRRLAALFTGGARVIGIGSPRASLEANFALRTLVGRECFHLGMSGAEFRLTAGILDILRRGPARTPSLHEVESADAVFVLGEDVTNTAPMLALALRQAVRQRPMKRAQKLGIARWDDTAMRAAAAGENGPLFVATPGATKLDDVAAETFRGAPDELARLGFAVAHALDAGAPAVADLPESARLLADRIAQALLAAEHPLLVAGTSCGSETVVRAAANVAWALCRAGHAAALCYTVPECNSLGLALMEGESLAAAFEAVRDDNADAVVILENDLYRRAEAAAVDALLSTATHVVVIDHLSHATSAKADVVLPAATFAEAGGTLVSNEGRAQRFFQVLVPEGDVQESWHWLHDALAVAGRANDGAWLSLDHITAACAAVIPVLAPIISAAPASQFRIIGQRVAREPHHYSGRTAMLANVDVNEPKPPDDPDAPLSFSMEGYAGHPPSPLIPYFWAPGWNSVQSVNKFQQEVGGALRGGDPGVRLIEPTETANVRYFGNVPEAFARRDGAWLVLPFHHIFGSEELSARGPAIAALAAQPYLALGPADAADLGVGAGDYVELRLGRSVYRLPLRLKTELGRGIAGLPAGLPRFAATVLPAWGVLTKVARP